MENRLWKVTRIVKEEFEVFAVIRQEAKDKAINPYNVEIIRESAILKGE